MKKLMSLAIIAVFGAVIFLAPVSVSALSKSEKGNVSYSVNVLGSDFDGVFDKSPDNDKDKKACCDKDKSNCKSSKSDCKSKEASGKSCCSGKEKASGCASAATRGADNASGDCSKKPAGVSSTPAK